MTSYNAEIIENSSADIGMHESEHTVPAPSVEPSIEPSIEQSVEPPVEVTTEPSTEVTTEVITEPSTEISTETMTELFVENNSITISGNELKDFLGSYTKVETSVGTTEPYDYTIIEGKLTSIDARLELIGALLLLGSVIILCNYVYKFFNMFFK